MRTDTSRSRLWASCLVFSLALNLGFGDPAHAQGGKKPKGGGDSGTTAPLYEVSLFSHPENGVMFSTAQPFINEALQVVGKYYLQQEGGTYYTGAFYYDPWIHAGQAIDLDGVVQGMPEGFVIGRIGGINNTGMIAVSIRPLDNIHPTLLSPRDPGYLELAGVIDTANAFQFHALPDLGSDRVFPQGINISGDVVLVVNLFGDVGVPSTHVASEDASGTWQVTADVPSFVGTGISNQLQDGSTFLIGSAVDETVSSETVKKLNLATPNDGTVTLSPVQVDKNTTYEFLPPSTAGINSQGDFVGILEAITERTRRGETTTSTVRTSYLHVDTWEEYSIAWPRALNDSLDFLAEDVSTEIPLLVRRGVSEPIDLLSVIDTTSALEVDWSNPDLRLECFDLTNAVVSDDGNTANDLPIIVGIEKYELDNPYVLDARHAFLLMPIQEPTN